MGNRFNDEARKVAAGQSPKKLKNKKGRGKLGIVSDIDSDNGKISRDAGSVVKSGEARLPVELERTLRKIVNNSEIDEGGGEIGRRR